MQARRKPSFFRRSPLAYLVAPLLFALVSAALIFAAGRTVLGPYLSLAGWVFTTTEDSQPQDLLANAATVINGGTAAEQASQPESIPLSSITYPVSGDRYATITLSGTNVNAPVYYGDTNKILNQGVGTYVDDSRAGIPGEGKPVAKNLLPGVQIIWYLLHYETTPFTNTCKTPLFCSDLVHITHFFTECLQYWKGIGAIGPKMW